MVWSNHSNGKDGEERPSRQRRSQGRSENNPWGTSGGGKRESGSRGTSDRGNTIDFEEFARKMSSSFGGGGSGSGGSGGGMGGHVRKRSFVIIGVLAFFGWLATGIYTVQPDEQGIVLRFGKYERTTPPGLHMHFPTPIERVLLPRVTQVNQVNIGFRAAQAGGLLSQPTSVRDVPEESLILTGDENIVDVDFSVFWLISDAEKFLFQVREREQFVKAVSESAMREIIGTRNIQSILTQGRAEIQEDARNLIQSVLDGYNVGVKITQVQLEKVDPPEEVIGSFRDVQAALADKQRLQNEAESYANKVIPEARGVAAQLIQQAEGYADQVIAEAKGQTARFDQVYSEYSKAPEVTRYRIYMETMEKVLQGTNKVLLDDTSGGAGSGGVVPYLPLSALTPSSNASQRSDTSQTQSGDR